MAVNNPQANYSPISDETSCASDVSGYETDETNDIGQEMNQQKRDRAISRDIEDHVIFWINALCERKLKGCVVMPVVTFSDKLDDDSVKRRREILTQRLEQYDAKAFENHPKIVFGARGKIPIVSPTTAKGLTQMRRSLQEVSSVDPHMGIGAFNDHLYTNLSPVIINVRDAINSFKEHDYDIVHFEQVYMKLIEFPPEVDNFTQNHVREALAFLDSIGFVMFFDDASRKFDENSRNLLPVSEFVILNPKWLCRAMSTVLSKDLRYMLAGKIDIKSDDDRSNASSITRHDSVIMSSEETIRVWKNSHCIKKQYGILEKQYSESLCDFLQCLCEHLRIFMFVEIDDPSAPTRQDYYLLPSLKIDNPPDVWSFKAKDPWKTTLCNSWLFRKQPPCDLMDQISVLVYEELKKMQYNHDVKDSCIKDPQIICGKSAMYAKVVEDDGVEVTINELFINLVFSDSPMRAGTSRMRGNDVRLIVAAKGLEGAGGRKIWALGYTTILEAVENYLESDSVGAETEGKEVMCPQCLLCLDPSEAYIWKAEDVYDNRNEFFIRCCRGHSIETPLLLGPEGDFDDNSTIGTGVHTAYTTLTNGTYVTSGSALTSGTNRDMLPMKSFEQLSNSIVLVGHWSSSERKIINVGSGFIADSRRGLIVTAGHIFYDLQMNKVISPKRIGSAYTDDKKSRIQAVIGTINPGTTANPGTYTASFKYIAEIVAHCMNDADACILKLVRKFEVPADVVNDVHLPEQPEYPLGGALNPISTERLSKLPIASNVEVESNIRIVGYDQCGEGGLHIPGQIVHSSLGVTKGYVNKQLPLSTPYPYDKIQVRAQDENRKIFLPQKEVVVMCNTKVGNSGGPCVNDEGQVIGIVSRTDPADPSRCYLAPAGKLKELLKKAKRRCDQPFSQALYEI